jgi:hypothetical protein
LYSISGDTFVIFSIGFYLKNNWSSSDVFRIDISNIDFKNLSRKCLLSSINDSYRFPYWLMDYLTIAFFGGIGGINKPGHLVDIAYLNL